MHSDLLLVIVVAAALAFDFTNGFHDTANAVAATISTRALSPRTAIALSSVLNFVGALISLKVAATIATGIIDTSRVTETVAICRTARCDLVEPDHMGLWPSLELLARADRRGDRRAARGGRRQRREGVGARDEGDRAGDHRPDRRLSHRRPGDPHHLPSVRASSARTGESRVQARADPVRFGAVTGARDERRPEDDGRDHARARGARGPQRKALPASRCGS